MTVSQARIARAHYARLAELHAYSHDHAIASRRYTFAVRCERDYRRAARRCHLLGGFIRANSPLAPASWEASVEPSPEVGVAAPAL